MRIISVVGARPQFVKAAVVSRAIRRTTDWDEKLLHTGQHYDANMSSVFFQELEIPPPAFALDVGSGPHGSQTGRMLERTEAILQSERPDWVLVYGDTNSTLAGTLAAVKLGIPVAHVEAGLRSYNRRMPEEINRVLTDHASSLLLAPTQRAIDNLMREGVSPASIRLVGDVMYDATLLFAQAAASSSRIVEQLGLAKREYVLATIHRAENTDEASRLVGVFEALMRLSRRLPIVVPVHPRTVNALTRVGLWERVRGSLRCIDPVGYLDMLQLESHARLVATDSGGVQKEAFFCGVPCVTLRAETEWTELCRMGWNTLVDPGTCTDIHAALARVLDQPERQTPAEFPYGRGDACERIVLALQQVRENSTPAHHDLSPVFPMQSALAGTLR